MIETQTTFLFRDRPPVPRISVYPTPTEGTPFGTIQFGGIGEGRSIDFFYFRHEDIDLHIMALRELRDRFAAGQACQGERVAVSPFQNIQFVNAAGEPVPDPYATVRHYAAVVAAEPVVPEILMGDPPSTMTVTKVIRSSRPCNGQHPPYSGMCEHCQPPSPQDLADMYAPEPGPDDVPAPEPTECALCGSPNLSPGYHHCDGCLSKLPF